MNVGAPPPAISTRVARPLTVSGVIGLPGGPGVDVSYHLSDRLAVSAQASSWLAVTDVGAQVRFFPLAGERAGLYLAAGPRALVAPILLSGIAPGLNTEIGGEFRGSGGFTIGGGIGVTGIYVPRGSEGGGGHIEPAPHAQLRIGYSW